MVLIIEQRRYNQNYIIQKIEKLFLSIAFRWCKFSKNQD